MDLELAEAIVKELLAPQYLSAIQVRVFRAAWAGDSYQDFADASGYEFNYVKGVGAQIWKMLETATSQRVTKSNFRAVLASFVEIVEPPKVSTGDRSISAEIYAGVDLDRTPFYGREHECGLLWEWISIDRCCLVTILGMGGIGKTAIVTASIRQLQSLAPENSGFVRIWRRSLLTAPPLIQLLPELLRALMGETQLDLMPNTVTTQIELLLSICQQYRCAIVLDNVEALFEPGAQVGQYRSGYEDYGELLATFGQKQHQSCAILTSREKPIEIGRLEGIDAKVRSLLLSGLELSAGHQIFADRGCEPIDEGEWAQIDRYCDGNPLILQSIAMTVCEVGGGFAGDLSNSLRSSRLGFADIHILLEQHWERLTLAEQQVMYWLAIFQEPISLSEVEACLHPDWHHQQRGRTSLLSVLQALQHRSLIATQSSRDERTQQRHWTLSPMAIEYTIERFVDLICMEIEEQKIALLDTHALVLATAKEYIRHTQVHTIVRTVIDRLKTRIGNGRQIGDRLRSFLTDWKRQKSQPSGYLAGNILNLCCELQLDLSDWDCSALVIRQAYLAEYDLMGVNFTNSRLIDCRFAQTGGRMLAIAYSPDGKLVAAGDSNGDIRLWGADGRLAVICRGHRNWVRSIAFSPDNHYLASASDDRTLGLWDTRTGARLVTIGEGIHSLGLSFSPDGRYLAAGSTDNIIYYWELATGNYRQLVGHDDWSMAVCHHPHGHKLASASADRTVRIWDLASGKIDRICTGHSGSVTTIDWSADGKTIVSGSLDASLRLWDSSELTCRLVLTRQGDEIWSVAFSPDGELLASVGAGGNLAIWQPSGGTLRHHWTTPDRQRWYGVAFHPDGRSQSVGSAESIASCGEDGTICFWQVSDGRCWYRWGGNCHSLRSIAWSPDGNLEIAASRDGKLRVAATLDRQDCQYLALHPKPILSLAFAPHGLTFASGSEDRTIGIWDARTRTRQYVIRGIPAAITVLTFSANGRYLVGASTDRSLRIWDVDRHWARVGVLEGHIDRIEALAYHPSRDLFASASEDRTVRLWHPHEREPVRILPHAHRALAVAFAPHAPLLATGEMDSEILLWDIDTGELCRAFSGHEGWILCLAYSADGNWLFSGSTDRKIKMWSMATGQCIATFSGHRGGVRSIALGNGGQWLISACEDETVRIWDVTSGNEVATHSPTSPYAGMNITGISGLSEIDIADLQQQTRQTLESKG